MHQGCIRWRQRARLAGRSLAEGFQAMLEGPDPTTRGDLAVPGGRANIDHLVKVHLRPITPAVGPAYYRREVSSSATARSRRAEASSEGATST
jgi:hypothetical protein